MTIALQAYFKSSGSLPMGIPSGLNVIFSMRASASLRRPSQCFFKASPRS